MQIIFKMSQLEASETHATRVLNILIEYFAYSDLSICIIVTKKQCYLSMQSYTIDLIIKYSKTLLCLKLKYFKTY